MPDLGRAPTLLGQLHFKAPSPLLLRSINECPPGGEVGHGASAPVFAGWLMSRAISGDGT